MSSSPVLSLHRYFVVASRMQHHFDSNLVPFEDTQSATKEDPNCAVLELFAGPRGNFKYYWYGSLYVVVEGFQNLHLNDPTIGALVQSPNANALRRCRNGVFHFRPSYLSARSLKLISAPDFVMMHVQSEDYCCGENLAADYANLASDTGEVAIICLS